MSVKIFGGKPVSYFDLEKLESKLKKPLMPSFRKFILESNCAKIESNIFNQYANVGISVENFIPAENIWETRRYIDNLPNFSYPIARDASGNFIIINQGDHEGVFFWDHETNEYLFLASDFDLFISKLKSFNISNLNVSKMEVTKEWVDPDFLKSLNK